ncbi:alpha/beta hydrolase [Microbacterium sp. NPDC077184]|uniref:alpha/beta hydrolase n=1 Tax=Microbacterium sp. NPDC077184 TaxID=3154764 RepID=UPI0034352B08
MTETQARPIADDIRAYVETFRSTMEDGSPDVPEARRRYAALLATQGRPDRAARTQSLTVPTRHGDMGARLYLPEGTPAGLLLYMHGGGFVVGDLDSVDLVLQTVCVGAGIAILSVDYYLAPEYVYPVAFEQCIDALIWAAEHRSDLGGDGPLAIGGDSAGGNLTALLTHWAATNDGPSVSWQAVINPVLDFLALDDEITGSHALYGDSPMLSIDAMTHFMQSYFPSQEAKIAASALRRIDDYSVLPPTFLAAGQCDPLRDESVAYAGHLAAAGVPLAFVLYEGMTHNFITLSRHAKEAQRFVRDFTEQASTWAARERALVGAVS